MPLSEENTRAFVTMTKKFKQELEEKANEEDRTLSSYLLQLIKEAYAARQNRNK